MTSSTTTITVLLLLGLPASGKSTLASKLKNEFDNKDNTIILEDEHTNHPYPIPPPTKTTTRRRRKRRRFVYIEYDAIEESLLQNRTTVTTINNSNHIIKVDQDNDYENNESLERQQQQQQQLLLLQKHQREAWNQARVMAMEILQHELEAAVVFSTANHNNAGCQHTMDIEEETATALSTIILLDDNFHLRGMRKQIHRLLLRYNNNNNNNNKESIRVQFGILWITCSVEMCLERNRQRNIQQQQQQQQQQQLRDQVTDQIIRTMNETFEPPTKAAWEISNTLIISQDTSFQRILDFVEHCPDIVDVVGPSAVEEQQHQQQQATIDRAKTLANQTHKLDQMLRRWVGQIAKYDKNYAKAANVARKELLQKRINKGRGNVTDTSNTAMDGLKDEFLDLVFPPAIPWEVRSHIKDHLSNG
jgi:tRNA uridine 5-carbamoylmethylation protein Kti12